MEAKLVLEDGSCFEGISIGTPGEKIGEVVLNTAVVGYQEMMTDPANAGKILVLTYPLIGNYGVAEKFNESKKCWLNGLVIKENSRMYSNWQAEDSLDNFLKKEKVVAIAEIDTRTLAVNIREKGEIFGIISTKDTNEKKLLQKLQEAVKNTKKNFIKEISVKKITKVKPARQILAGGDNASGANIAILDLGITNGFIKQLETLGCNITLLPYNTDADDILKMDIDGVIISNGPEDDEATPTIVKTVNAILGKIPILGISTGHEIIALALEGKLEKMKMGHRGVNYPVKSPNSFKGEITVQNHSFIVDEDSIKNRKDIRPVRDSNLTDDLDSTKGLKTKIKTKVFSDKLHPPCFLCENKEGGIISNGVNITLRNVNDNSIEEMESKPLKFISTQYYPVSPGFEEINEVFIRFLKMVKKS